MSCFGCEPKKWQAICESALTKLFLFNKGIHGKRNNAIHCNCWSNSQFLPKLQTFLPKLHDQSIQVSVRIPNFTIFSLKVLLSVWISINLTCFLIVFLQWMVNNDNFVIGAKNYYNSLTISSFLELCKHFAQLFLSQEICRYKLFLTFLVLHFI